jgi:5-methylcytosine-specific restriction enzyme A
VPTLVKRPCRYHGCPELVQSGFCHLHIQQDPAKVYDRARRGDPNRIYDSARWRKLRLIVLRRQPVCMACSEFPSTVADHIIPIRDSGRPWDLENIQGLCSKCHGEKTNKENSVNASRNCS